MTKNGSPGYAMYMQERAVLNRQHGKAYEAISLKPDKKLPRDEAKAKELTAWMCANFYDIRAFGAVMTTEVNCGQVRGPIQLAFAQSIDPIVPLEISITRSSVTNERDLEKERTMGRKHIVPYGLYRAHGFISANLAERSGFSDEDLELFWGALKNMFDHDRSAARGEMAARRLIVFKHKDKLGNAPAHKLFEAVVIAPMNGSGAPRSFADYRDRISINTADIPSGVEVVKDLDLQ
jgi:CRISPR-associated protein Csd2